MSNLFQDPSQSVSGQSILVNRVLVNDTPLNQSPTELKRVKIKYSLGMHDQAILTTRLTKSQSEALLNQPIYFTFGPQGNRRTFHGYVSLVNPARDYQKDMEYTIIALGVTQPLQSGRTRFFQNKTGPQIVGQVITEHGLGFYSDPHAFVHPSLAQTHESDWQFVNRVAKLCGMSLTVYDGIVRMVDAERSLTSDGPQATLFKGDQVLDSSRKLLAFEPKEETERLYDNISPSYGFFDKSGDPAWVGPKPDEARFRMASDVPVFSKEMGEMYERAWYRHTDFWLQGASARIVGDPKIMPGGVVAVRLSDSRVVLNDFDGIWYVIGVEHDLTNKTFQSNLILARDAQRRPSNTDFRWFYARVNRGRPRLILDPSTDPKTWKSNWTTPIIVGGSQTDPMSSSPTYTAWSP